MNIQTIYRHRFWLLGAVGLGLGAGLASCVSAPTKKPAPSATSQPAPVASRPAPTRPTPVSQAPIQTAPSAPTVPILPPQNRPDTQQYTHFGDWKSSFEARTANVAGMRALLGPARLNESVIRLDNNQAEFTKMVWEYLDGALTQSRVNQARQKRQEMINTLTSAENTYGVPASVVTAIWGLESSFGANMGKTDLVDALSSLAYSGRRRAFAENELVSMAHMIARGDIGRSDLKGSWAGGMGHTQFIPSTWMQYGVDADGDGRKNPFTKVDSLTSTAHYLASAGWVRGLPAYIEVNLPAQFEYRHLGASYRLDDWRALGLVATDGTAIHGAHMAQLFLPAGIHGPKLLTTPNFEVIKVYNNSSNYALAVSTLANRMNGKAGITQSFPRHEQGLSKYQIQRLQQNLSAQGYNTGGIDGIAGANTRKAFASWQAANGQIPDGFITQNSAQRLIY